jgi:hypothetical protein
MNIYIYLHLYLLREIHTSKDIVIFLYIFNHVYKHIGTHTRIHTYLCMHSYVHRNIHTYMHIHINNNITDIRRIAARCFRAHGFVGVTASGAARADERLRPTCVETVSTQSTPRVPLEYPSNAPIARKQWQTVG